MMANWVRNTVRFTGTEADTQLALAICIQCSRDFEGASLPSATGGIEITYLTRYSPDWELADRISTVLPDRTVHLEYCEPMMQIFGKATFENGHLLDYSESIEDRATEWSAHSGLLREYTLVPVDSDDPNDANERQLVSESARAEDQIYGNATTSDACCCPFAKRGPCPFGFGSPADRAESRRTPPEVRILDDFNAGVELPCPDGPEGTNPQ